ncbi:glycosyltransferase [Clostridium tyrobutyricum]|nr:glycosyltransferase [Clostridium tyrobutyricum]
MFDYITEASEIAYEKEIKKLGGNIYYIPRKKKKPIQHLLQFRKILKTHNEYNIIYFNILSASYVYTIFSLIGIKNIKILVHSHNNNAQRLWLHLLCKPILQLFSIEKLACSKEAGKFMFGKNCIKKNKVKFINNAIEIKKYIYSPLLRENVRNSLKIGSKFVVGSVGRLSYQKNSLFIIDIFSEIYKKDKTAILIIAGEGDYRKKCEKYIQEKGIKDVVYLLGMRNDIPNLLQGMDIFLFPSRFEGLGMALIEAQAAGLKCFTSMEAVPKEVKVTPGLEFISLKDSAKKWASVILKNKNYRRQNYDLNIKQHGFDIDTEAKKLENLFLNI